jgi:hypothetical protein
MPEVEDRSPVVGLVLLETARRACSRSTEVFFGVHSKVKSILGEDVSESCTPKDQEH